MQPILSSGVRRHALDILVFVLLCALGGAQTKTEPKETSEEPVLKETDGPVTAWILGRILPVGAGPIDRGVLLVQKGRLVAVGKEGDVEIPTFATRREHRGSVACPGFVHPASTAYLPPVKTPTTFRGTSDEASKDFSEELDPQGEEGRVLKELGYTTVATFQLGGGLVGRGALVRPLSRDAEDPPLPDVVSESVAVLSMGFAQGTAAKKFWKERLERARKYLTDLAAWQKAQAEKPKEEAPKKPEGESSPPKEPAKEKPKEEVPKEGEKKEEKKEEEKKEAPKKEEAKVTSPKEPAKDEKLMPLVDLLEGRLAGILGMPNAAAFLHFAPFFEQEKNFRPAILFETSSFRSPADPWNVADRLRELGLCVILSADLARVPQTTGVRVPQRMLWDLGIAVALVPGTAAARDGEAFRFQLAELVRHGAERDLVLRAVTLTPAELLGIENRCGSLERGKDADFLLFDGDPLEPTARLQEVVIGGTPISRASDEETPR